MYARKIIAAIVAITLAILAWLNLFYQINSNTSTTTVQDLSSVVAVVKITKKIEIKI